jgi:hypothetical protein
MTATILTRKPIHPCVLTFQERSKLNTRRPFPVVGLEAGRGAEVGSWDRIPESPPINRPAVFYANPRNLTPDLLE